MTATGVHASVVNNYSETSLKAAVEAKIAATSASVTGGYATKELWVAAAQQAVVNDLGVTSCKLTLTNESMLGWTAGATYSVAYSVVYNTATYTGTTSITVVA